MSRASDRAHDEARRRSYEERRQEGLSLRVVGTSGSEYLLAELKRPNVAYVADVERGVRWPPVPLAVVQAKGDWKPPDDSSLRPDEVLLRCHDVLTGEEWPGLA